jgi:putative transposase
VPYWRLHYHLVWATKNRDPLIDDVAERTIRQSIASTSRSLKMTLHAIGMVADHVHVAVSIPPSVSVSEAVGRLKGASSHALHNSPEPLSDFSWQAEYGALSISGRGLDDLIEYVVSQPARHAANHLLPALERIEDSMK